MPTEKDKQRIERFKKAHPKYWSKRGLEYKHTHPEKARQYREEYEKRNPEKAFAHNRNWLLPKEETCTKCASKDNLQRHHPDYSKPKEVVTLCHDCHTKLHEGELKQ